MYRTYTVSCTSSGDLRWCRVSWSLAFIFSLRHDGFLFTLSSASLTTFKSREGMYQSPVAMTILHVDCRGSGNPNLLLVGQQTRDGEESVNNKVGWRCICRNNEIQSCRHIHFTVNKRSHFIPTRYLMIYMYIMTLSY